MGAHLHVLLPILDEIRKKTSCDANAVISKPECAADQRLCFRYISCAIPLLFKSLAIFCDC